MEQKKPRDVLQFFYMPPTRSVGSSRCSAQMPPYELRLRADRLFVTHTVLTCAEHLLQLTESLCCKPWLEEPQGSAALPQKEQLPVGAGCAGPTAYRM